jgi:hypothetical protein
MRRLPASCNILLGFHALELWTHLWIDGERLHGEKIGRESIGRPFIPTGYRSPVSSLTSNKKPAPEREREEQKGEKKQAAACSTPLSLSTCSLSWFFFPLGFHLWIGFCLEHLDVLRPGQIRLHQPTSPYQSQNKIMPRQHTQASMLLDPPLPGACCLWKNVVGLNLTSVHKFGPCLHAPLFCLLCLGEFFLLRLFFIEQEGIIP